MDTLTVQVWKLDFRAFKSPAAKLVALAIARRSRESGSCWAKHSTLGEDCGVSKQTVGRCLDELMEAGWLQKVGRRRSDGSRSSDRLWLTLPQITLESTSVDPKELKRERDEEGADWDHADNASYHGDAHKSPRSDSGVITVTPQNTVTEGLKKKTVTRAHEEPSDSDLDAAVDLIWQMASKVGRGRSSKADIKKGLQAALARGNALERVLRGMGAYLRSPDATKDDGAYQRGAHVMLANDRWASHLDDEQARRDVGHQATPQEIIAQEDVGTIEAPSESRQRLWMELFAQGMPWGPERGPQPGRLGCRVSDAIQRAFGVEPYQAPAADQQEDGDSAAFD